MNVADPQPESRPCDLPAVLDVHKAALQEIDRVVGNELTLDESETTRLRGTLFAALNDGGGDRLERVGESGPDARRHSRPVAGGGGMSTCDHTAGSVVFNASSVPVRLICTCGEEWRVVPVDALVTLPPTPGTGSTEPERGAPSETHAGYPGSGLARCGAPVGALTVAPGEEFTCRKCGEVRVGDDKCPQCGAFERTEWLGEDRRGTNNGWRCFECKHTWYTPTRTV